MGMIRGEGFGRAADWESVALCIFDQVLSSKSKPTGRVPSDAILFSTPKKYAKRLAPAEGTSFACGRCYVQLQRLMNTFVLRGTENQSLLF
jgi:hypothetical protein